MEFSKRRRKLKRIRRIYKSLPVFVLHALVLSICGAVIGSYLGHVGTVFGVIGGAAGGIKTAGWSAGI